MGDSFSFSSHFHKNLSSSRHQDFLSQILLHSSSHAHNNSIPPGSCNSSNPASLLQHNRHGNISPLHPPNLSSSSPHHHYHSQTHQEGVEAAFTEEFPTSSVPSTSKTSSKRSRAAQVHNLSEKRRRSRINEKMKALQNLIPNSNKTDKASMLDEAIEYLKQLQLQVQMLSMRNGLNLHPMCFPEGLQTLPLSQMSMEFSEGNKSTINMAATLPLPQENMLYASDLPNKHTQPSQQSVHYPSYINNRETSFGLESQIPAQKKPFQQSSEGIHSEDILQHQQSNAIHSATSPLCGSRGEDVSCYTYNST